MGPLLRRPRRHVRAHDRTGGPHFGTEHLLDVLAESSTLANLAGENTRYLWPDHYDLRRIPIVNPAPVYPHSLIWHADNAHPALAALLDHVAHLPAAHPDTQTWTPAWAREVTLKAPATKNRYELGLDDSSDPHEMLEKMRGGS